MTFVTSTQKASLRNALSRCMHVNLAMSNQRQQFANNIHMAIFARRSKASLRSIFIFCMYVHCNIPLQRQQPTQQPNVPRLACNLKPSSRVSSCQHSTLITTATLLLQHAHQHARLLTITCSAPSTHH